MPTESDQLLRDALVLSAAERAVFADELLTSLNCTSAAHHALCLGEATDRVAAYEAGKMDAIPAEEVFAELERL